MSNLKIYDFEECQQCGKCCEIPCDLIPSDLPGLLNKFEMSLPDFFKKYLISLLIASPQLEDEILMMVPVKVDVNGNRTDKLLADKQYLQLKSHCIFLDNGKCAVHENKPFGGKFLYCPKITGSVSIQLPKNQYFAYWAKNQHLFDEVVPGYMAVYNELKPIFQRKNEVFNEQGETTSEYRRLQKKQFEIITKKLFPLFNCKEPEMGFKVLI